MMVVKQNFKIAYNALHNRVLYQHQAVYHDDERFVHLTSVINFKDKLLVSLYPDLCYSGSCFVCNFITRVFQVSCNLNGCLKLTL